MNLLGVDFGQRRVGLARATSEGRLASPWRTLEVSGREDAMVQLTEIVRTNEIDVVVLGLPLDAAGSETAGSLRVQRFGKALASRSGAVVAYQDEYATSCEAQSRARGVREPLDHVAAALILDDYLRAALAPSAGEGGGVGSLGGRG